MNLFCKVFSSVFYNWNKYNGIWIYWDVPVLDDAFKDQKMIKCYYWKGEKYLFLNSCSAKQKLENKW